MKINSRNKGANGERQFCKWLESCFNLPESAVRNLEQVRSGGADVIVPPFCFEVKRREGLSLKDWWIQAKTDAKDVGLEPVVAFRQNRKPWEFLISARHIGCRLGFLRLDEKTFREWAESVWLDDTQLGEVRNGD